MPARGMMMRTAAALGAAAFLASGAPAEAETSPRPAASAPAEEDLVLLQLQVKNHRMRNDLRGYQTASGGVCVDFADMILALDLPVRLDKKSRRATGGNRRRSRSIATKIRYKS